MTKSMILPLESARLVEYAIPVVCYVCETENGFDADACRFCGAPMALAHQARSQKLSPQMIACLGVSGAGKTVYLGMLMDMLSRSSNSLQILARGAFSITLQQTTMAALAAAEFPGKTPCEPDRWNWVHCQVRRPKRKQPMEVIMPDMAGEAILGEIDHPRSYRIITAFLKKCSAAMVLVDTMRLLDGAREQEYFVMKLVSYLAEMEGAASRRTWLKRPMAFVFTKADQCEDCIDDPAAFARSHAPGLWQQCQERFRNHRFFATGVAGSCAYRAVRGGGRTAVPLRIEPRGILEPFEWLVDNLKP